MEKVLEVEKLSKLYKKNRGVIDISFKIFEGDIYGLLGPNGAGKTTIMKAVTGLIRKNRGSIKVFDIDISKAYEKAAAGIGAVLESDNCYEYLSAYDNLRLAARFYKNIKSSRIDNVLELVGLDEYKKEKASNFSLGMKQRLAVAAALLSKPRFVILDEPSNGLDIEGIVEIRNLIKRLNREEKITFFISSHMIHEIELTCSRVGVIYGGRLIKEGLVQEILKSDEESLEKFFLEHIKIGRGQK